MSEAQYTDMCNDLITQNAPDYFWFLLADRHQIPISVVTAFSQKNWNWEKISVNASEDDINNNPSLPWNYRAMAHNKHLSVSFVDSNINEDWNFSRLSKWPGIIPTVQANPDKDWDWAFISLNPNLTLTIVESLLDKEWDWYELCRRSDIGIDITWVNAHPNVEIDCCELVDCYVCNYLETHPDTPTGPPTP